MDTLFSFRIRSKDKCERYECKGNLLTATGIRENKEDSYKVITSCNLCGEVYAFTRLNKRLVK